MVVDSGDEAFTLRADGEALAVSALTSDEGVGVLSAADDPGVIIISAFPRPALESGMGRFLDEHPDLNVLVVGGDVGAEAAEAIAEVAGEHGLSVDDGT